MNRRGDHCLCWCARTSALLFIIGRHNVEGSGVISVEQGDHGGQNSDQEREERRPHQSRHDVPCLGGVGRNERQGNHWTDMAEVFLKALLATAVELAKLGGLWWEEG
jgi:hypothetical protein